MTVGRTCSTTVSKQEWDELDLHENCLFPNHEKKTATELLEKIGTRTDNQLEVNSI